VISVRCVFGFSARRPETHRGSNRPSVEARLALFAADSPAGRHVVTVIYGHMRQTTTKGEE
jgi:hypothetical protein